MVPPNAGPLFSTCKIHCMKNKILSKLILLTFLFIRSYFIANAQQTDTDSSVAEKKSSLQLNIGFSSTALEAGRDAGVKQYSISPSVTYNHKSGLWVSVTGSYLSESEPQYNLTVASLGYGKNLGEQFSFGVNYSRNFFHPDSSGLLKNIFGAGLSFSKNWFSAGTNYAYLSGEETGHSLVLNTSGYWGKETSTFIDAVSVAPGAAITFGTANISLRRFGSTLFEKGYGVRWQDWISQSNRPRQGSTATSSYEFGLMNIDLIVPVSFYIGNFSTTLSYSYAIPMELAEEQNSELKAQGYFGIKLGYVIQ